MTQEDKALLLKDLCARLPYGLKVKCEKYSFPVTILYSGNIDEVKFQENGGIENICAIKPYLFPLSSMTIEQQKEANIFDDMDMDILSENLGRNHRNKTNIPTATYNYIDWLNKNHFDYRGLIKRGLAIDATGLNIY